MQSLPAGMGASGGAVSLLRGCPSAVASSSRAPCRTKDGLLYAAASCSGLVSSDLPSACKQRGGGGVCYPYIIRVIIQFCAANGSGGCDWSRGTGCLERVYY